MRYPWGQLLQPSLLSGIQQSSRKPRSYCVCFPSAPVAPEPNVSGPVWLTLCSHIFLSAVFTSFTWKALTNYKNWKKKLVHSDRMCTAWSEQGESQQIRMWCYTSPHGERWATNDQQVTEVEGTSGFGAIWHLLDTLTADILSSILVRISEQISHAWIL